MGTLMVDQLVVSLVVLVYWMAGSSAASMAGSSADTMDDRTDDLMVVALAAQMEILKVDSKDEAKAHQKVVLTDTSKAATMVASRVERWVVKMAAMTAEMMVSM